jgi:hypothetical protein
MNMDERVWDATVFTKNRNRLFNQERHGGFFRRVVERASSYMSDEHFSLDGTLIEAWASQKSFQPKQGGLMENRYGLIADAMVTARGPDTPGVFHCPGISDESGSLVDACVSLRRCWP